MVIRGVYTKAEQKMLDDTNRDADLHAGWGKSPNKKVATEESMRILAAASDYKNPIWSNDNYAMNTRWGGIIGFPKYEDRFSGGMFVSRANAECGFPDHILIGDEWEFFKPVRPGDTFKVWRNRPHMEDITSLDGEGPRRFKMLSIDLYNINQNEELVSTHKRYLQLTYHPEPLKKVESMPESVYRYTKEELAYIYHIEDEEEIRGDKIRYWEDINVGDILRPVELGPTTAALGMGGAVGGGGGSVREMMKRAPWMYFLDPETGVYHSESEQHLSDRAAQICMGRPMALIGGGITQDLMVRLVTNWMGDDGFMRKYNWRHLAQTPIGDTFIGKGTVVNKRVENGEYLVDIAVYLENIRGFLTEAANITVRLYSKATPYPSL